MANILITGGNRGVGLELARKFSTRGDNVIVTCRQTSPELAALSVQVIENIDVASDQSVQVLADLLANESLDVIVNNAGILSNETIEDLNFDRMRQQFDVNTLGPLRVTKALLSRLKNGSKVIIITSRMGSCADNSSGGFYGYRISKAAVNMAGINLSLDLKKQGVAVGILHPGMVATQMTGGNGVPTSHAAEGLIARIDELTLADAGKFWHAEGEELPW